MSNTTTEGLTSADIKKQITEATREIKAKESAMTNGLPLTGMVANEINATDSTTKENSKTESKSEPVKATEKAKDENSFDYKEWAKKKGVSPDTDDETLKGLRMADEYYHKKQAEKKAKEAMERGANPPVSQQGQIPSQYPPVQQNPYGVTPPPYAPTHNQRQIIEELARANNMTPEDFERVAKVSREVYEASAIADRQRWEAQFEEVKRKEEKNSVFRELSTDPVFKKPGVAEEYYNVLDQMQSADPQSFEKDPNQYRIVLDRAITNIGRRYLEGRALTEGTSLQPRSGSLPMNPPKPLGQGSGGGYNQNESAIDPQAFAKMSMEEKRKTLESMGLRSQYQ